MSRPRALKLRRPSPLRAPRPSSCAPRLLPLDLALLCQCRGSPLPLPRVAWLPAACLDARPQTPSPRAPAPFASSLLAPPALEHASSSSLSRTLPAPRHGRPETKSPTPLGPCQVHPAPATTPARPLLHLYTALLLVACQDRLRGFTPSTTTAKYLFARPSTSPNERERLPSQERDRKVRRPQVPQHR